MKTSSLVALIVMSVAAGGAKAQTLNIVEIPNSFGISNCIPSSFYSAESGGGGISLADLAAAGVSSLRVSIYWNEVEKTMGDYNTAPYTTLATECAANNISLYGVLQGGPTGGSPFYGWNDDHTVHYGISEEGYYGTLDFRNGFKNFVASVVGAVDPIMPNMTWEYWNEPNVGFWPHTDTATAANQYMRLGVGETVNGEWSPGVFEMLRSLAPGATVVGGAVAIHTDNVDTWIGTCRNYHLDPSDGGGRVGLFDGWESKQAHDLEPAEWRPLIDALSIHTYANPPENAAAADVNRADSYAHFKQLMNFGTLGQQIKIINGETGYGQGSDAGACTPQQAADNLQRMRLVDLACDVPQSFWFDLKDDGGQNCGIFDQDGNKKPAYYAMKALNTTLFGQTVGTTHVNVQGDTINYEVFTSPGRNTMVAWTTADNMVLQDVGFGTALLCQTPLYMGDQWTWNHNVGPITWSTNTWNSGIPWVNIGKLQAKFSTAENVTVDGEYILSGIQMTGGNVTLNNDGLNPSKLRFTLGGGAIHTGNSNLTINCSIADFDPTASAGSPDLYNNPAACILRKSGTGDLTLSAANTIHAGILLGTQPTDGKVWLTNAAAAQNATLYIINDANGDNHWKFGNGITTFQLGGLAGTGNLSMTNVGGGNINFQVGGDICNSIYNGSLTSGTSTSYGWLEKIGTGELTLAGSSPGFKGTTFITGGTLTLGAVQALGSPATGNETIILRAGGCLNMFGWSSTGTGGGFINSDLDRPIALEAVAGVPGAGISNTDTSNASIYSGVLSGNASLIKYGDGELELRHANLTFTGTTIIKKGMLTLGDARALGLNDSSSITLDGGVLNFAGRSSSSSAGTNMNRSIVVAAGSTGSGIANINAGSWGSAYTPSITAHADFTVNTLNTIDLQGAITCPDPLNEGWAALVKTGTGTLMLNGTGNNNTNLSLVVNEGVVNLTKTGAYAAIAAQICQGGTIIYFGDNQIETSPSSRIELAGGTVNFNGKTQTGTTLCVTGGGTLANTSTTEATYSPSGAAIDTNFTVDTPDSANSIVLSGGLVCPDAIAHDWPNLTKNGYGTLRLTGTTGNSDLTLIAACGTVKLDKLESNVYAATAAEVRAGATVQYTGINTNDSQINSGGWLNVAGGTVDFNGKSQTGTNLYINASTGSTGSTLANTAAGTTSTYSPYSATLNANLTVNAVGGLSVPTAMTGTGKLIKDGTGTLTLSKANTYSGGTTVKAGTLLADFTASGAPTTNILPNTGVLTLSGGTLQTKFSSASSAQTVASTTVSSGGSVVKADNAAATLNLNAITRNTAGGTVDFLTPANIAHISTSTLNCNPTGLKQSILGGYATFGGNTWAVSNNTAGTWNIYGLGSYSTTFTANQDVDAPVNTSTINPSGSGLTINSLRFNKSTNPSTVSISSGKILTVATGGILETSTVGTRAVTISGGSSTSKLTSGGLDLIVHQNNPNASMTINANISGTNVGLTKSGAGNLILGGTTKSYTGVTTVNGGTLTLTGNINTTSGVTLNTGGTLLQNSGTALNKLITFNGGTLGGSGQYSGNINMGSSSGHLSPGDAGVGSIGTLTIGGTGNVTLGSTSVLDFDLTNTTAGNYDVLALSGTSRNLTLDGTINITSSTGVAEGNYPIITGITGTFVDNILNFGTVPSGHSSWRCYKDGTTLYVHAAPEPGTIVLLATALLSLLAYAWRKRK